MTLLVLDLKLPDLEIGMSREEFATVILQQAPRLFSWLLSFAILARLWIMQYGLLAEGDTRTRGFVGWTFLFLGAVSFIPFPTSLLSEHHDQASSVIIFSGTLAVAAIALLWMERLERRQRQLTDAEKAAGSRSSLIVAGSFLVTAVLASGVAILRPVLGVWIWAGFPFVAAVMLLFHLLGFLSSIDAVMSTRTAQGAIAWVVSLNTFPYLAVPAYWVLGRSRFEGYVDARQGGDHEIRHIALGAREKTMHVRSTRSTENQGALVGERIAKIPYLRGNEVELLIDGQETFDSIFAGIDSAEDYILVQFFIVKDDEIGRELHKRLLAKAKDGVKVYFLYDEVGSHSLSKSYIGELRDAGVEILDFHTRKGPGNRFQINFRNHRKIVVVDGHTAWVGGHNVGDEYMGRDPEFGHWRDTHVRITGPAALAVQLSFLEDWHWATGKAPEFGWVPHIPGGEGVDVLIFPTGPADPLESATLGFISIINTARERIWIASPYFVPDESLMNALHLAALRGVDVRIIIPDKADHTLVWLAAFSYFEEAQETGIRFFRYMDGFLHQKVVLVDDEVSAIGTANFDNRSFRLNFEIMTLVADPAFNTEVEQMLLADMKDSVEMQPGDLAEKSFWFKLASRLARLTAPIQ